MVKSEVMWPTLSDGNGCRPLNRAATLDQGHTAAPLVQPGSLGIRAREGSSVVSRTHHFDALEEERQRLLREIHDGPAQVLSNIGLRLDYLAKLIERDPERVHSELKFLQEDVSRASLEMRRFMYELAPPGLAQGDLRAAIEGHCERVAVRFGLAVTVWFDVDPLLTRGQQTAIFRIVQEAIQNVIKHACATSVIVRSFLDGSTFVVSVQDNGTGLDNLEERLLTGHHFGLYSMRARARQVGASIQIGNGPEQGVVVTVRLPLDDL